ncbi:MAG: DNA polymerase III subunit delta' [Fluviicola sp.]|nr:DNA polymerase III subunit delta' [Fluviicola sp.]
MQFSAVIGQDELKHHLLHEVQGGKISHAQLFLGKPGYGSLPLALAFVQYLFCENRSQMDSCGECAQCRKVSELQHPDLHFSFPTVLAIAKKADAFISDWRKQLKENPYFNLHDWTKRIDSSERKPIIGVDESLEIIKKLNLKSFEGGYKVMVIWMAEEMNADCANKLLKILEEPTPKTLFILLAEAQDKMLTTILSRTQIVRVTMLPTDTVQQALEQRGITKATAASIAGRSDGDFIEAQHLLGDTEESDYNRELFIQLMRVCFKKDVNGMLAWTDAIATQTREGQKLFLKYALHMVRQSILKNYTQEMLTKVSTEEAEFLKNFARFITNNNVMDFMQLFNDSHYHLERNAHAKLLFTQLCFQVMRFIHRA